MKQSIARVEKALKDLQIRESRKDNDMLTKQLDLKSKEVDAYLAEIQHQKQENVKLRERLREIMARSKGSVPQHHIEPNDQSLVVERD